MSTDWPEEWDEDNDDIPVLPYFDHVTGRSSGHSGTDTSAARAHENDASGVTGKRQKMALVYLDQCGEHGSTWYEMTDATGLHHGITSGTLSNLDKSGKIFMLTEVRKPAGARTWSHVYVLPEHLAGRSIYGAEEKQA